MDLYQILQVAEDATREDIRAAYLVLVQETHPDRRTVGAGPAEVATDARFKRIQEAFEILHDPARRAEYDRARVQYPFPRGRAVVHATGPTVRRDIPVHWLHRSGSSRRGSYRRSKRRLRRWILWALVLAIVAALLSLGPRSFWRRLSSRAADDPPALRSPPQAPRFVGPPHPAPAAGQDQTPAVDPAKGSEEEPGRPPEERVREKVREKSTAEAFIADIPPVEASLSQLFGNLSGVVPVSVLPPEYLPLAGEFEFEPGGDELSVFVPPLSHIGGAAALSAYTWSEPIGPLDAATIDPLLFPLDSSSVFELPLASMAGTATWADGHVVSASVENTLLLDLPLAELISAGPAWSADAKVSMPLDSFGAGAENIEVFGQLDLPPSTPALPPTFTTDKPPRQRHGIRNQWDFHSWNEHQRGDRLTAPRHRSLPSRRLASSRWASEPASRTFVGGVSPTRLNQFQPSYSPRSLSPAMESWSTAAPRVEPPATGIQSVPLGSSSSGFEATAPSRVFPMGDSFYRRDLGP